MEVCSKKHLILCVLLAIINNVCTGIPPRVIYEYLREPSRSSYDFIIIGSGSSGAVLANRLTEISNWNILLIEAGRVPMLLDYIPLVAPYLQMTDLNWGFNMEKTPNACLGMVNQQCKWPRGKGLGGTTLINYMMFIRGNKKDFDTWAAQGNPGWTYEDVLPYFKKLETAHLRVKDAEYHGTEGNLNVGDVSYRTPIADAFIKAGNERGYPYVDYNGKTQDGVSYLQATTKRGKRFSAYNAYIKPAMKRNNLHVLVETRATKILIDPGTKQAYGVEFHKGGKYYRINVTKEVIVSTGALISPQLLMLSGIGPKQHLQSFGIPVIQDLQVGQNLQDHNTFLGVVFKLNETVGIDTNRALNPFSWLQWYFNGKGPLVSPGGVEALGYYYTNVTNDHSKGPDVEFLFVSGSMNTDYGLFDRRSFGLTDKVYNQVWKPLEGKPVWTIMPLVLHPYSVGHIELQSANPYEPPKFFGNYFSDPNNYDIKMYVSAIREIIELSKMPAFQRYASILHDIPVPGCESHSFGSDAYWECAVRHVSGSLHHQVGTIKMGPSTDPTAVVDNECKVYGIKGLRVIDTSVIPFSMAAHTNGPAYMVGEKMSDTIKRNWGVL